MLQLGFGNKVMNGINRTAAFLALSALLKDNRLLPAGLQKQSADKDIAVTGDAADDPNFTRRETRSAIPSRLATHQALFTWK